MNKTFLSIERFPNGAGRLGEKPAWLGFFDCLFLRWWVGGFFNFCVCVIFIDNLYLEMLMGSSVTLQYIHVLRSELIELTNPLPPFSAFRFGEHIESAPWHVQLHCYSCRHLAKQ